MNKGLQRNSLQNLNGAKFCKNSIKKGYQKGNLYNRSKFNNIITYYQCKDRVLIVRFSKKDTIKKSTKV
jgi:hypothetical protein